MPQKFPGAARRDFTRNRVKGPKFSGATRRNPTNRAKRPKIFRRYAPGDPPPDFPAHIQYVSTALFSNLAPKGAEAHGYPPRLPPYSVMQALHKFVSWELYRCVNPARF